jgi:mono/diheme cytochrome c family protein
MSKPPPQPVPDEPPQFDIEAARARYRKMMRSWPMRTLYILLALVILFTWAWGIAAAIGPDVENLPGHDITVPTERCIACHSEAASANNAPPMNHPAAPTCGFCHRQGLPETSLGYGAWAIETPPQRPNVYAIH